MLNNPLKILLILFLSILTPLNLQAQISVAKLFNNGTVLQRDVDIPIWGWGEPSTEIAVTLGDSLRETTINESGKWSVSFSPRVAGGPFSMSITTSEETINFKNIMIGDVYMISGQSNMEYNLSWSDGGSSEASSANFPNIREFKIPKSTASEESDQLAGGSWNSATSTHAGAFSAIGYYFAKEIHTKLDIPIGLINNSYGGARIEAFMSEDMLGYDENDVTLGGGETERQPTLIFNKMVKPILPYAYKGVLWYQAESNGDSMEDALAYGDQFLTLITAWRDSIALGDLPFIWIQLQNFNNPAGDTPSSWDAWPQLRAQQSRALSLPNTGEVITIDVGGVDIHPTNKKPVGDRLALLARKLIYGEDIVANSPRYLRNVLTDSGTVIIDFNAKGAGLISIGNEMLNAFALAGQDGRFKWANAKIENNRVLVWNSEIPEPYTIRYAWEYNPGDINLYNSANLPAAPFEAFVNIGFRIYSFESERTAIEVGQSTNLSWEVFNASSVSLNGVFVDTIGSRLISPIETTTYELIAVNKGDSLDSDTSFVTVEVLSPEDINRTYGKPTKASTVESCCGEARLSEFAVDEDLTTRWSSAWSNGEGDNPEEPNFDGTPDEEWIMIDLEEYIDIDRVILEWEAAFGSSYDLQVSLDSYLWTTVYEERSGNGGEDNITFDPVVTGRFLRMKGIERATVYGYSLFEISAFGKVSTIEPPSIRLYSNHGNFASSTDSKFSINAEVSDTDGSVTSVEFFLNNEPVITLTEAPFTFDVQLDGSKEYLISAIVTDDSGITIQSETFPLYQDNGTLIRFEAESSTTNGEAIITSDINTSKGSFLDLRDAWTVTFDPFNLWESGEYLVNIRYQLTYESPKVQYLVVNNDTVSAIEFTAPNTDVWLNKAITVNFEPIANNVVAIHGFWNWMSIDYIEIEGVNEGLYVEGNTTLPTDFNLFQNHPNPFNPSTNISFALPKSDYVELKVFDLTGRLIASLVDEQKSAGTHTVTFDASTLSTGIYFYQLKSSSGIGSKKMILIK